MGDKEYKVIKLDKVNYVVWKWQFKNILKVKGIHSAIVGGDPVEDAQALALLG